MTFHFARPLLPVVLALSLVACGNSSNEQTAAPAQPAPPVPAAPPVQAAPAAAPAAPAPTAEAPVDAGKTGESSAPVDMLAVAKRNGCLACHAIDKKVVGPAWKDVAAKYKGDGTAADKLSAKVKAGGSGVWGAMPMPANPKVSDADMKDLITFILGL